MSLKSSASGGPAGRPILHQYQSNARPVQWTVAPIMSWQGEFPDLVRRRVRDTSQYIQAPRSFVTSAAVGGPGKPVFSMAVPYRLELQQYTAVVGPVQVADVTAPSLAWVPQLVTASRGLVNWGAAVSSGLTPPGVR